MDSDPIRNWVLVVSTAIVAICAFLTLILKIIEKYPMKINLKKKIVTLKELMKYLQINLKKISTLKKIKINPKNIIRGLTTLLIVAVAAATTTGIIALFLDNLLPAILGDVVKKEFNIISQEIKKDVLQDILETNEKLVTTLFHSDVVRTAPYRDALKQANHKGYIEFIDNCYMTSLNWREEEKRLLTIPERLVIKKVLPGNT